MLKACFPFLFFAGHLFSYILVYESVLPPPEATSITRIARTAIALPTRLLDGQITSENTVVVIPVLNSPLGTNSTHQQSTMNWSSGWQRPPAGPQVNILQFTVANQIFVITNTPAIIEIDLLQPKTQPSPSSRVKKEPEFRFDRFTKHHA